MSQNETRTRELFVKQLDHVQRDTDQLFFWLLLAQWGFAIMMALWTSPYEWVGRSKSLHVHLQMAIGLGGLLNVLPLWAIRKHPGKPLTRHLVAGVQMLWSALLIDVTGGRIETHFHIFGSLAFLAFYRDTGVLVTATLLTALDHVVRGLLWPEAVYGSANPEWWRFLEHSSWVLFEVVVLTIGTTRARRDMLLLAEREAELEQMNARVEREVFQRTSELGQSLSRYRALVEDANVIPWEMDPVSGKLVYIAPQAPRFFGCAPEFVNSERFPEIVHPDDRQHLRDQMAAALRGERLDNDFVDYRVLSKGRVLNVRTTFGIYKPGEALRGITLDISRQTKLEGELRQAQKLESVGKLAAGVAHEINTPVQFVSDSVHFVQSACGDVLPLLSRYQAALNAPELASARAQLEQDAQNMDLAYLTDQIPRALTLALDGLSRVTGIVRSMKEFAYPHTAEMVSADLNQAVQSTLTIARGEYKYVAELETSFADLPRVRCHIGDINQVVLNLVVNAAQAIGEQKNAEKGKIKVSTRCEGDDVVIAVEDTGGGIPESLQERIYDPFFTTKAVGSGTGQGLAIARTIVVDRHQGALWFDTRSGIGTTFYVRLPIAGQRLSEQTAA